MKKILKESIGERITVYLHLRADSSKAELEYSSGSQVKISTKKLYENGSWKTFDTKKEIYEKDPSPGHQEVVFTGASKKILDYTCLEVRLKDSSQKTMMWVCKDFPKTISPGITVDGIDWAIFEYTSDNNELQINLKSIQKIRN